MLRVLANLNKHLNNNHSFASGTCCQQMIRGFLGAALIQCRRDLMTLWKFATKTVLWLVLCSFFLGTCISKAQMTGQHDRQSKDLSGQQAIFTGHCPLIVVQTV